MTAATVDPLWQVVHAEVTGRKHPTTQDAYLATEAGGQPAIVALADGHGSARHFRSGIGSRIAVEAACQVLGDLVAARGTAGTRAERLRAEGPGRVVQEWRARVGEHLVQHPLARDEIAELEGGTGRAAARDVMLNPLLAYGSTLLALALTDDFLFYLQVGDGDILEIAPDGAVSRPLPPDPRLIANQTTSLCLPGAERAARTALRRMDEPPPALVMMATDGYGNSYRDDASFHQVGSDLLAFARAEGIGHVREQLPVWLRETSHDGSGDDITVALLYHAGALSPLRPAVVAHAVPDRHREEPSAGPAGPRRAGPAPDSPHSGPPSVADGPANHPGRADDGPAETAAEAAAVDVIRIPRLVPPGAGEPPVPPEDRDPVDGASAGPPSRKRPLFSQLFE